MNKVVGKYKGNNLNVCAKIPVDILKLLEQKAIAEERSVSYYVRNAIIKEYGDLK